MRERQPLGPPMTLGNMRQPGAHPTELDTVTKAGRAVLDFEPAAAAWGFLAVNRVLHASTTLAAAAESAEC
jgi:hypothetical protein